MNMKWENSNSYIYFGVCAVIAIGHECCNANKSTHKNLVYFLGIYKTYCKMIAWELSYNFLNGLLISITFYDKMSIFSSVFHNTLNIKNLYA